MAANKASPGIVHTRLDISPRGARVYRYVIPDMLLQTPAAQELLPGGELSEQSW
jgi:hypothetical protein